MGIYLNPGNAGFKDILKAEIYVDKTGMLSELNKFIDTGNKYICVSRPRRFGKTIAGNMISAYYSKGCDSRELFSSMKISSLPGFEDKLNKYNVIKIDLNGEYQTVFDKNKLFISLTDDIKKEMSEEFPDIVFEDDDSLAKSIMKIYAKTGETFILIIDEYDVLIREQAPDGIFKEYLAFLNGLFKNDTLRPAISLAYLTGILPVVRDKIQSKLNNFEEYTIIDAGELAEFTGFTDSEVKELCEKYDVNYDQCKLWYDGYTLQGIDIYNPESVVKSIKRGRFGSYWGKTSTYEAITDRIRQNFEGTESDVIKMLSGEQVYVNITSFLNTMDSFATKDDLFTYLTYIGYLAYDLDTETCRIPNKEVRQEWFNAIAVVDDYKVTNGIIKASKNLVNETVAGNEEIVAEALDETHIHVTSNRSYNNEDALCSAIYLAYIHLLNTHACTREMTAGKGFADMVYVPVIKGYPAFIIELKRNKTAESAIRQIRDKKYFKALDRYEGEVLFVGINYDEEEKTHQCKIERFEK